MTQIICTWAAFSLPFKFVS